MADRQTTGGYPNVATVISADIGLAGQLAPGDRDPFRGVHAAARRWRRSSRRSRRSWRSSGASGRERSRRRGWRKRSAPSASDGSPARAVDDVPRRRTGRMVRRNADQRRNRSTALRAGACGWRTGDGAGRRLERPRLRRGSPRSRHPAAGRRRLRGSTPSRVRADAAVTINGLVRWTIMHGCGGPRSVGRHARYGRRRRVRQRALRRAADRRSDRRGARRRARRDDAPIIRRRRWHLATIAAVCRTRVKCCCRRRSGSSQAIRRRCARRRASRSRFASARSRSIRRARGASFRTRSPDRDVVPEGIPWSAGRARRPRGPEGRGDRRRARLARRTAISSSTTDTRRRPTSGG